MATPIPPDAGEVDFDALSPPQQQAAMASPEGAIVVRDTGQVFRVRGLPKLPEVPVPPMPQPVTFEPHPLDVAWQQEQSRPFAERLQQAADPSLWDAVKGTADRAGLAMGKVLAEGVRGLDYLRNTRDEQVAKALEPIVARQQAQPVTGTGEPTDRDTAQRLQYIRDQIAAAGGAAAQAGPLPPEKISLSGGSSTTPDITAGAAARLRGEAQEQKGLVREALKQRSEGLSEQAQEQKLWGDRVQALYEQYGERAGSLLKRFDAVQDDLDRARQRLEQSHLDPLRLMREMPTAQKVLGGLGAALGAAFGTKAPMELLERAMDRDFAGQRANVQTLIQSAQLTQSQANALWNQYTHMEQARRTAFLDASKLKIAAAGAKIGTAAAMDNSARLLSDIGARELDVEKSATPKKTTQWHQAINPAYVAALKERSEGPARQQQLLNRVIDKELRKEVNDLQTGEQRAVRLISLVDKAGSLPLSARGLANSPSTTIDKELKWLALMLRRSFGDSGPVVVTDFSNYGVPGAEGALGRTMTRDTLKTKLAEVIATMRQRRVNSIYNAFRSQASFVDEGIEAGMQPSLPTGSSPPGGRAQ